MYSLLGFFKGTLFYLCLYICVTESMYTMCVWEDTEARKRQEIPCNWSDRWLCDTIWVLGIEFQCSARANNPPL